MKNKNWETFNRNSCHSLIQLSPAQNAIKKIYIENT